MEKSGSGDVKEEEYRYNLGMRENVENYYFNQE